MGFGSLGETGLNRFKRGRKAMKMGKQFAQVEIPVKLQLTPQDVRRLENAGKYGVRNALKTVAEFALEPAREEARKLSSEGIGRASRATRTGRGGITEYTVKGKRRKIRSYRAGVKKKGAYSLRGRSDGIGDVTLLLSVKTTSDYYNFVANFWEHGWNVSGTSLPGNQFMTKAVERNLTDVKTRFAQGVAAAVEVSPRRLRKADLKGLG
jgi:hypothetical protein